VGQPAPARPRSPRTVLRRVNVRLPAASAPADALFILMRRVRGPLILVIAMFSLDVVGMTLMPGADNDGNTYYMTIFDAFYFWSYAATTIGFGETPYNFTVAQRMWVTFGIYNSVICWAFALGSMLSLFSDRAFQRAIRLQRFGRQVRLLREPFLIIAGYGQMGRRVAETLDAAQGRRLVVIDTDERALDQLASGRLSVDVPAVDGDVREPTTLALAGLTQPYCEGVLALTHDDAVNMAVVMAVQLLRPEVPVYARANDRAIAATMHDFKCDAVINPYDRFGDYLQLRLSRPTTYRLVTWLLAPYDEPLGKPLRSVPAGRWVVASDDHFGTELAADLRGIAENVDVVDVGRDLPPMTDVVGFIAGGRDENRNLALAAHARLDNPDVYIAIRASSESLAPLLTAFAPDTVFIPSKLTAQEALARVVTPDFWAFFQHAFGQDEQWSEELLDRLVERQGEGSPASRRFVLNATDAPGVVHWLAHETLTLADLLRDPADRDQPLSLVPLILTRGARDEFVPSDDTVLQVGDEIVMAGHDGAMASLEQTLFHPSAVEYVATGRIVPSTWLFRRLSPRVQNV